MIAIDGLAAMQARMARLELDAAARRGLTSAGRHLAREVRTALSTPPGGPHAMPWLRTGALRDSITVGETAEGIVVASGSEVAVHQELGTRHVPPRPFLAPTAAAVIGDVATMVATEIQAEARQAEAGA